MSKYTTFKNLLSDAIGETYNFGDGYGSVASDARLRLNTIMDNVVAAEVEEAKKQKELNSALLSSLSVEMLTKMLIELRNGSKINAIRVVRESTNLGLKEAKDFVDAIHRELGGFCF